MIIKKINSIQQKKNNNPIARTISKNGKETYPLFSTRDLVASCIYMFCKGYGELKGGNPEEGFNNK